MLPKREDASAGHAMHVVIDAAAVVNEYVSVSQAMQADEPVDSVYFPGTQAMHAPVLGL